MLLSAASAFPEALNRERISLLPEGDSGCNGLVTVDDLTSSRSTLCSNPSLLW
jgi:hypothetical protein